MRSFSKLCLLAAALAAFAGGAPRSETAQRAAGTIAVARWPYLPGTLLPVRIDGLRAPYSVAVIGSGAILPGDVYAALNDASPGPVTLIAGSAHGLAERTIAIAAPPNDGRTLLAVASYDDGIIVHDAATLRVIGVIGTTGAPSDIAADANRIATTDTQGRSITVVGRGPWSVTRVGNAPLGDNVAIDRATGAIFVTDRDADGGGALTRIGASGAVATVATGMTPEGLAIDQRRQIVYVANTNDDSIAQVDARTMRVVRRFHAVARVFGLALSPDGTRLYATSNQSAASPFAAAGSVVAIDVAARRPYVVARSGDLTFPVGIALDPQRRRIFVTDESSDEVYVLDDRTLRARRAPLRTCRTPWQPLFAASTARLYVPCAGSDQLDVFTARALARVRGAPFATGGYPLAVTLWHGHTAAKV